MYSEARCTQIQRADVHRGDGNAITCAGDILEVAGEGVGEGLAELGAAEGVEFSVALMEGVGEGLDGVVGAGALVEELVDLVGVLAAVVKEFPAAGEAAEAGDLVEGERGGLEDFVGGIGVVECAGVLLRGELGAGEAFELVDLELSRAAGGEELVEVVGEVVDCLAGESVDEVGMDVGTGVVGEPCGVGERGGGVGGTADGLGDGGVEGLEADFEVELTFGVGGEALFEGVGEVVGVEFEVERVGRGE